MKTTGILAICMLALTIPVLPACSGSDNGDTDAGQDNGTVDKAVEEYMPAGGSIGDWVEDTAAPGNEAGIQSAHDLEGAEGLIDGHIAPFQDTGGYVAMAMEWYVSQSDDTKKIELRLYEMSDATTAKAAYDDARLHMSLDWDVVTLGDEGRIYPGGQYWVVNIIKGKYFVEVPRGAPGDDAGKTAVEAFLGDVVAGLP